ncbi:NUDIX domain-containing protein [Paenibacillus arenosi]|uniref:NUDIX domain-containing protein n=1 Tax=Paenibacillus arenosi TaxID=2774142 RepID=A0ABR9B452_9BACL|nr:NUDIX domain-containing protein [Paenibacillus arenosi]MBD8501151.1 NUDIX domain-containing protein [Paenibacillus arenosi]
MTRRIIVTGGAIIRDNQGRILLQKRSDYGDWGLPGGGMDHGETIEETMIREVKEETGLEVLGSSLDSINTGERMEYTYPDGTEVVFVMFLFQVEADLQGRIAADGERLIFTDPHNESLRLIFKRIEDIDIKTINKVQKPVFKDLKQGKVGVLRN